MGKFKEWKKERNKFKKEKLWCKEEILYKELDEEDEFYRLFYLIIKFCTSGGYYITVDYISKFLKMDKKYCYHYISCLREKNFIEIVQKKKNIKKRNARREKKKYLNKLD